MNMSQNPAVTPIAILEEELALIKYNADGLIPVVTQDAKSKQVLMMAWMNAETLRMTLTEGRMVYYSRSRQEIWRKGDTSGDRQFVREGFYDCDNDTLLFLVEQEGNGACHTGAVSCFYRKFGEGVHDAH
jgi:phosphoribosyl-AMP cyclohydrolase/phosphoribosyl-ATP pyrophosphohydrolase/phosphoribosyl-AMP cyclohydrolase